MKNQTTSLFLLFLLSQPILALTQYQCWQVPYTVTTYNSQGQVIGYYEDSYEECGWVVTGGGSGSGGGGTGGGSGSGGCDFLFRRLSIAGLQVASDLQSNGHRVVIEIDMDGDDIIVPQESIDLQKIGVSLDYFFRILFKKNHKAIQVGLPDGETGLLVMDLNQSGDFDHRKELLGNQFTQERIPADNAGMALMNYDEPGLGGNGDGLISSNDFYWNHLYIWRDTNQNGVSEPQEMLSLDSLGIVSIDPRPLILKLDLINTYEITFNLTHGETWSGMMR